MLTGKQLLWWHLPGTEILSCSISMVYNNVVKTCWMNFSLRTGKYLIVKSTQHHISPNQHQNVSAKLQGHSPLNVFSLSLASVNVLHWSFHESGYKPKKKQINRTNILRTVVNINHQKSRWTSKTMTFFM